MSHISIRGVVILTTILVSFAAQADKVKFRWGDINKNSYVKYDGTSKPLYPDRARCYLYLGEAKIEKIDKDTSRLSLEGLTYVCDTTSKSTSDWSFGNHTSGAYLESELVSAKGGQKYSIIVVSTYKTTSVKQGFPIEPGSYYSIAVKTGTSVQKEDTDGNAYASFVINHAFGSSDYSMPGEFVAAPKPPVGEGGYMWGSPVAGNYRVPDWEGKESQRVLCDETAHTYLYLGKAEYKNGVLNLGELTFVTNSTPTLGGNFGNYTKTPTADILLQSDLVNPKGGQDFTVFFITPDASGYLPPIPLVQRFTAYWGAYQIGTSVSAVTSDGITHAQLLVQPALGVADFIQYLPFVDVGGSTMSVH